MTRTQIQLPEDLYQRAKNFAAERELSLAEVARRGIELFIARFPNAPGSGGEWMLPRVDGGGAIPLHQPVASEASALKHAS